MKCAAVIQDGSLACGTQVPDLPGCVAAAATGEDMRATIGEAIHPCVGAIEEDGLPVPRSQGLTNVCRDMPSARRSVLDCDLRRCIRWSG